MKIQCPICPVIKENLINYLTDTKKIFTPDFIQQNYHKHLGYSLVLTFFAIWLLFINAHLGDTGILFPIFVGAFGAYAVNFLREWYYGKKYNAPWDWTDLNMGSYGGILGTVIYLLANLLWK